MVAALALLGALVVEVPASAQDAAQGGSRPAPTAAEIDEGRRQFEIGSTDYEAGRFEDALERFRRAYELTRAPDLLYNVATVLDRLRRDDEALATYERYLAEVPGAADRGNIEARVAVLRSSIERARAAAVAPEPPPQATVSPPPGPPPPIASPVDAAPAGPVGTDPLPWIVVGAGGALAVTGAILLGVTAADIAAVQAGTSWAAIRDAHDRVPIESGLGISFLAVGVAGAAAGIVWGIVGGAHGGPRVSLGPGAVRIEGSF